MHHLVFGINFQIHSVSLISPVSIHLLIHLSTHPCHHRHSIIHHSFTFSLQAQNLLFQINKSFLLSLFFFTHWTAFMIMGLDRTYPAHSLFLVYFFYIFVCSEWKTKLAIRQLFTVRSLQSDRCAFQSSHSVPSVSSMKQKTLQFALE